MKILVLSTGGTIGSATKDGVMSPDKNATALLVLLYESSFQDVAEFDCESVSDILSENVTEPFYEKLINRLLAVDTEKYDGVIVLHGTDTLAYTSSLAAMVCRSLPVPVGFVGANYPLKHPKSNAFVNFRAAVEYLKAGGRGFFVPYENSDGKTYIHLATRLTEADFLHDDFHSLGDAVLAEFKDGKIIFSNDSRLPSQEELSMPLPGITDGEFDLSGRVVLLKSYPGLDYSELRIKHDNVCAVVNVTYHTGSAPCAGGSFGLPEFCDECHKNGVDVYLAGLRKTDDIYETSKQIYEHGAEPIYSVSVPAAVSKLRAAYNSSLKNIDTLISNDIYYESLPQEEK